MIANGTEYSPMCMTQNITTVQGLGLSQTWHKPYGRKYFLIALGLVHIVAGIAFSQENRLRPLTETITMCKNNHILHLAGMIARFLIKLEHLYLTEQHALYIIS